MPEEESPEIVVRSGEIEAILGLVPSWIVRSGIAVLLVTLVLMLVGSWFFRYPDVQVAPVVVTTENPPAVTVARASGRIQHLFVGDNQPVKHGDRLAVIENPAKPQDMLELRQRLEALEPLLADPDSVLAVDYGRGYALGEVQAPYELFVKSLEEYRRFVRVDRDPRRVNSLKEQIAKNQAACDHLSRQAEAIQGEVLVSEERLRRAEGLFQRGVISKSDLEAARSSRLQQESLLEATRSGLASARIQIAEIEKAILELSLERGDQRNELRLQLNQAYKNLASQIGEWEQKFVLVAPVDGRVSFNKYWSSNQNVSIGDSVFSVVPDGAGEIIGRVVLPVGGSGRVRIGQRVNIKLSAFPYTECGIVRGLVRAKSLVPADAAYLVEVELPDGLTTDYGVKLPFGHHMDGVAEIVTEDIRLFERLFNPLKAAGRRHLATGG